MFVLHPCFVYAPDIPSISARPIIHCCILKSSQPRIERENLRRTAVVYHRRSSQTLSYRKILDHLGRVPFLYHDHHSYYALHHLNLTMSHYLHRLHSLTDSAPQERRSFQRRSLPSRLLKLLRNGVRVPPSGSGKPCPPHHNLKLKLPNPRSNPKLTRISYEGLYREW